MRLVKLHTVEAVDILTVLLRIPQSYKWVAVVIIVKGPKKLLKLLCGRHSPIVRNAGIEMM